MNRLWIILALALIIVGAFFLAPIWQKIVLQPYTAYYTETSLLLSTSTSTYRSYSTHSFTTVSRSTFTIYLSGEYRVYPEYRYYAFLDGLEVGDIIYIKIDTKDRYVVDVSIKDPRGITIWKASGTYIEDEVQVKYSGRHKFYEEVKGFIEAQYGFYHIAGIRPVKTTVATTLTSVWYAPIAITSTLEIARSSLATSISYTLASHSYAMPLSPILWIAGLGILLTGLLLSKAKFKYCLECGKKIPKEALECPYCHAKQE